MSNKQIPVGKEEIQDAIQKQHNEEVKSFLERYREFAKNEKFDFGAQLSTNKFGILPQLILVDKPIIEEQQEQENEPNDNELKEQPEEEQVIKDEPNDEQTN